MKGRMAESGLVDVQFVVGVRERTDLVWIAQIDLGKP
jgi:hypothetical protein